MMKIKCLIFFLLMLSACGDKYDFAHEPKYVHLAYGIMNKTAIELNKEKKMELIKIGGAMMHEVEELDMSFVFSEKLELKQARELMVFTVSLLLKNVNTNEEIRPYLIHYPFTAKDLYICLVSSQDQYNTIDVISSSSGKIRYKISGEPMSIQIHEETYEEALKIIEKEKEDSNCNRNTNLGV